MSHRKALRYFTLSAALVAALGVSAESIEVKKFKYAGPYPVATPWMADSVNVKGEKYQAEQVLDAPINLSLLDGGKDVASLYNSKVGKDTTANGKQASGTARNALQLASFTLQNNARTKATIHVEGVAQYRLYVDGEQVQAKDGKAETTLLPSIHTVVIKYLSAQADAKVSVETEKGQQLAVGEPSATTKRAYNLLDVMCIANYPDVSVSPNGKYIIVRKTWVDHKGKKHSKNEVRNYQTGKLTMLLDEDVRWMPRSGKMYFTQPATDGKEGSQQLVAIDPQTLEREILAEALPEGWFQFTPDEKNLVLTISTEGPKKDEQVYDIKSPDDRQPGWRNRSSLALYNLSTGILQPITFGSNNVYLQDISADSRYLLVSKSEERLTKRPTTVTSFYRLDLGNVLQGGSPQVETLVEKGEFVNGAQFSPDGKSVLFSGSPEAFDGIGKNVDPGQIPSMIDTQLYLMQLSGKWGSNLVAPGKNLRPLTKDFDPNVQHVEWSKADGNIYFTAEDKDCMHLFQLNLKQNKFTLLQTPEENIESFSLATAAPEMAFSGQSASNADRLYKMNTKALKSQLVDDLSARELKGIELGECKAWNYVNSRGDTLCCRYFDSKKQYPMIVNYYGGCSPTTRSFQSRYPHHVYAAMGYVVLVINPSGATGFGQKFSARHVDTAGEGVAEDIIASTKAFCEEHNYVNKKKIGCIGASYGGPRPTSLPQPSRMRASATIPATGARAIGATATARCRWPTSILGPTSTSM